jgi:hypothetical protein
MALAFERQEWNHYQTKPKTDEDDYQNGTADVTAAIRIATSTIGTCKTSLWFCPKSAFLVERIAFGHRFRQSSSQALLTYVKGKLALRHAILASDAVAIQPV